MATPVTKAIKVFSIIPTVGSQIICQRIAKMICGLKSLNICRLKSQNASCRHV